MKRGIMYILFVVIIISGTVSCFASKLIGEKIVDSVDIESMLFSNYEKTMEARNKMMDELLVYFESNGAISKSVKKRTRSAETTLNEKEDMVNQYFDVLDNMNATSSAINEIESKVDEIGKKYEGEFSDNVGNILGDGKLVEGITENNQNIVIGGDIYINKSVAENTAAIVNIVRKAKGEKELSEKEFAKRGFYCSQSAFMWSNSKWEDGKVKYRIAGGVTAKDEEIIQECMKKWEDASGGEIKFIKCKNSFWNKFRWKFFLSRHVQVTIDKNIGNSWATLGEQVRAQIHIDGDFFGKRDDGSYAFDKEVMESEVLHEMGHVLTLFHEHQRADRDNYVSVNYSRAAVVNGWSEEKAVAQYGKITMYDQEVSKEYDYDSIMHYWSSQSNDNGERDIVKNNGDVILRAMDLSEEDKAFIKELYSNR